MCNLQPAACSIQHPGLPLTLALQGSSRASGALSSNARRRSGAGAGGVQALDVLGPILGSNGGLLSLDLSGTAVPVGSALAAALAQLTAGAPNATKPAHGLQCLRLAGCQRAGGGGGQAQAMALREVLLECPALAELDVSGERTALAGWQLSCKQSSLLQAEQTNATAVLRQLPSPCCITALLHPCPPAGCQVASTDTPFHTQLHCCPAAGCRWVTAEALPQSGDALSLALALLPLRRARSVELFVF